eukprot:COSAG02_NODE_5123_length_4611_cov_5.961879_1_plen_63_part_00
MPALMLRAPEPSRDDCGADMSQHKRGSFPSLSTAPYGFNRAGMMGRHECSSLLSCKEFYYRF